MLSIPVKWPILSGMSVRAFMNRLIPLVVEPSVQTRRACLVATMLLTITMLVAGSQPAAREFIPPVPWDKVAHLIVFAGFGALVWVMLASRSIIWPVFIVAIIGFLDESMQFFTPGRVADPGDLAADIGGALIAVLVLRALQIVVTRR